MPLSWKFIMVIISIASIIAIATSVISMNITALAGPTFTSGKLYAVRVGEWTEAMQNPIMKAQYTSVLPVVVDSNPMLKTALEGADKRYEMNANSKGYATWVDQVEEVELNEEEANNLISMLPSGIQEQKVEGDYVLKDNRVFIEYNGNYYILTISTIGTQ